MPDISPPQQYAQPLTHQYQYVSALSKEFDIPAISVASYLSDGGRLDKDVFEPLFGEHYTDPYLHEPGKELAKHDGELLCACCINEGEAVVLFNTSGVGFQSREWPNFSQSANYSNLDCRVDFSFGMIRAESTCGRCQGHLGHIFRESVESAQTHYKSDPQRAIDSAVSNHSFCTNASSMYVHLKGEQPKPLVQLLEEKGVKFDPKWLKSQLDQNPNWLKENEKWKNFTEEQQPKSRPEK